MLCFVLELVYSLKNCLIGFYCDLIVRNFIKLNSPLLDCQAHRIVYANGITMLQHDKFSIVIVVK